MSLDRIERLLYTVSIALEILTGICAGLEDPDEAEARAPQVAAEEDEDEDEGGPHPDSHVRGLC